MPLSRRGFLKAIAVTAVSCPMPTGARERGPDADARIVPGPAFFPQSVASGDPKPHSVILWTRAVNPRRLHGDQRVILQVAADRAFRRLLVDEALEASAAADNCLRVRVQGLKPRRRYYYRFLVPERGWLRSSRIGRTKTAPLPHADVPVRFAFANCQDYIGRYYNSYLNLLRPENSDLDFVVHLGDYIYETTGDPSFQTPTEARGIDFADKAGAIELTAADGQTFFAAASKDNYRQLYRTYRSDALIQRVHERYPLIAIWDDHEFSNDHWQDNATYFNGRISERSTARKRNAEQVWFEYMPIDDADPRPVGQGAEVLRTAPTELFPNTEIYRDLRFGQHLHLSLSDTRTFRPDHLIPEDAFPGTVALDEHSLRFALGEDRFLALEPFLSPYAPFAELEEIERQTLALIVNQLYLAEGLDSTEAAQRTSAALTGDIDLVYANLLLAGAGVAFTIDVDGREKGISYLLLGKQGLFAVFGSRNLVIKDTFDLLAQIASRTAREDVLGAAQQQALQEALLVSDATWKVVASSVSFTSMVLDLTQDPSSLPLSEAARTALAVIQTTPELAPFVNRFYLSVDQWDGFPLKRQAVLDFLRQKVPNAVLIAGDIHATFVTDYTSPEGPLLGFTGPAISSKPFKDEVRTQVGELGLDAIPGIDALVEELDVLLTAELNPASEPLNPLVDQRIAYSNSGDNGVVVMQADGETLRATYYLAASDLVNEPFYLRPSRYFARVQRREFVVESQGGLAEP